MESPFSTPRAQRRPYVPAVGSRLRPLLAVVLALFALVAINGVYLLSVTVAEELRGQILQNHFYLLMFLVHVVLGLLLVVPFVVFCLAHVMNTRRRRNRRALQAGYALFLAGLVLLISGVLLVRLEGFFEIRDPAVRNVAYWTHVLSPLAVAWIFVLHRLAGPRIRWRIGGSLAAVAGVLALAMVMLHSHDPRGLDEEGPVSGERYFSPSLARTASGGFIPARVLMMDGYCRECHADVHARWSLSTHRFSSFNNPAYLFAVRETRAVTLERDGNVQVARLCAGCHDPVPFFSGAFDDPDFDEDGDPTAHAGLTCTACHAITRINSVRGNGDYTIEEPLHYPFAHSESPFLAWINRQLVKAKPELHKRTFLKPLHRSAEFCGTCHKVHLPAALNGYRWLRGQNHYDSYLLSGVSGHGVQSFYYPEQAEHNCNGCHMKPRPSEDFGARELEGSGALQVHDHLFPSANTALPHLLGLPDAANAAHREFTEGSLRVDLFGLKEGGTIDGALTAPLRPEVPALVPGRRYLLEAVVRTLKLGHLFTQGTADSNQVWLDVTLSVGGEIQGRSGGRDAAGFVDPWSHFLNACVLDREGRRIDRRNAQDIYVTLYDHQIPPGAADVVHYAFQVPEDAAGSLTVEVALRYRKFDTTFMRYVMGPEYRNDLPILTICSDRITFPVAGAAATVPAQKVDAPGWERWNDYGIGLLRKGDSGSSRGELRQAEEAFLRVEELGRPDGPLNRARVYVKEGRLDEAVEALRSAAFFAPPPPPWSVAWFTGVVNRQNGHLDAAIDNFQSVVETRFEEAARRGFDFGQDYRARNMLGATFFERAKMERGRAREPTRNRFLRAAVDQFRKALELDPENATAHYNLARVLVLLGEETAAAEHRRLHARYKTDDNARDRAVTLHRAANPAADHAADAIVIYDLQRPGAFGLPPGAASGEGR